MEDGGWQKWNGRGRNKRPPRGSNIPSWEKEFCRVVGALPWGTYMYAKQFVHLYDNVMKWDDSAGEEAFHNGKNRFWAKINRLKCNIPVPDPNAYIDKIDWDSKIDPELIADLESNNVVPNPEPVIIFSDEFIKSKEFSEAGWGENEENAKVQGQNSNLENVEVTPTGWPELPDDNAPDYGHGGGGYAPWGSGWNYGNYNYNYNNNNNNYNNNFGYGVGPGNQEQAAWNGSRVNSGQYSSNYRASKGNDRYYRSREDGKRNNSWGPAWNRKKPVS